MDGERGRIERGWLEREGMDGEEMEGVGVGMEGKDEWDGWRRWMGGVW